MSQLTNVICRLLDYLIGLLSHLIFSPNQNSRQCLGRSRFSARFTTHVRHDASFDWFVGLFASVDYFLSVNSCSDTDKSFGYLSFSKNIY